MTIQQITLATLNDYSAQEVFDYVCNHLLTQNKKSTVKLDDSADIEEDCAYRGDGNLKCAAGCLISEEEYNPSMEHNSWESLLKRDRVPNNHSSLIKELQDIHDRREVYSWKTSLKDLAQKEELKFNYNQ